ncbi:MAG: RNHCP domain-containing protein [Candidatus Colwellbacteria bacterium]|nr:RNHCP domain-containing protein [Candidatus Colwellbacteria bacterium]
MFIKKQEDFVCDNCGHGVVGTGYTNHCPSCLWSKHVDIDPGDRASDCGGMMRPAAVEKKGDEFILVHICERCGHEKRNKMSPEDDMEEASRI